MNLSARIIIKLFSLSLSIVSFYLLFSVDWKIAVGVFLFGWALNLDNGLKLK